MPGSDAGAEYIRPLRRLTRDDEPCGVLLARLPELVGQTADGEI